MGFVREGQTFIHHIIDYQPPRGWAYQLPNAPLINYNFSYNVMLWNPIKSLEIVGSINGKLGTLITSFGASSYIRYGLFNPYFGNKSLATATHRRFQLYIIGKPDFSFVAYNALLQGGIFSASDATFERLSADRQTHMQRWVVGYEYGIGFVIKRMSINYTQKTATEWMSGTGKHSVGNITLLIPISRKTIIGD